MQNKIFSWTEGTPAKVNYTNSGIVYEDDLEFGFVGRYATRYTDKYIYQSFIYVSFSYKEVKLIRKSFFAAPDNPGKRFSEKLNVLFTLKSTPKTKKRSLWLKAAIAFITFSRKNKKVNSFTGVSPNYFETTIKPYVEFLKKNKVTGLFNTYKALNSAFAASREDSFTAWQLNESEKPLKEFKNSAFRLLCDLSVKYMEKYRG